MRSMLAQVSVAIVAAGCAGPSEAPPAQVDAPDDGGGRSRVACEAAPASDFYTRAAPDLAGLAPGTALWCDTYGPAGARFAGHIGHRVAYVTTAVIHAAAGDTVQKVVAIGQVWISTAPAEGPRAVLVNTHGLTGVRPTCAPSAYGGFDHAYLVGRVPGAVIAVPDYAGLGRDAGLRTSDAGTAVPHPVTGQPMRPFRNVAHPYLSLEGQGRAAIDLVRAARMLEGAGLPARPRWLVLGVSQGGHAALAAGEVWSAGYGDDTELAGVVAGAPGSALDDDSNTTAEIERVLAPAVLSGLALEYPEIAPAAFFSRQALAAFDQTANAGCLSSQTVDDWALTFATYLAGAPLYRVSPASDPAALAMLRDNSPARRATRAPIFIGQVTGDPFITPARTANLVAAERARNPGRITSCVYPGEALGQPWPDRAGNHAAFRWMFGAGPATCAGPDGQPTGDGAAAFVAARLGAP